MLKRIVAVSLLFSAVGCGDVAPPTSGHAKARSAFGGDRPAVMSSRMRSLVMPSAFISAVTVVDPTSLTVTGSLPLNQLGQERANYDGVLSVGTGAFAERFVGQDVGVSGANNESFDGLSGAPSSPLTLQAGATNQNVSSEYYPTTESIVIDGVGPLGYPNDAAIGEGSLAVLFNVDQFELGFTIIGADGGNAAVSFYRRNGTLIETIPLQLALNAGGQTFAFRRVGSLRDIAGITIQNTDGGGIGFEDFRIDETQLVPANQPATVTFRENGKAVAGINIVAGTFAQDANVSVRFQRLQPGDPCHAFLIGQIGRCLEVTATDATTGAKVVNQQPMTIGLCLDTDRPLELYKFESATGQAFPLRQTSAAFVDCSGFTLAQIEPKTGIQGFALGVMQRVGSWITPKSAWASDRGFGGIVDATAGLSTFTWASSIQIASAKLAVNVLNRGKDVFTVRGTFNLTATGLGAYGTETGFNPATDEVIVAYGKDVLTIPINGFKYSRLLRRYLYGAAVAGTGITAMELNPDNGNFVVAGISLTQGRGDPTSRAFRMQVGHRTQGGLLECGTLAQYKCQLEH